MTWGEACCDCESLGRLQVVSSHFEQHVHEVFTLDYSLHQTVDLSELILQGYSEITYSVECTEGFVAHVVFQMAGVQSLRNTHLVCKALLIWFCKEVALLANNVDWRLLLSEVHALTHLTSHIDRVLRS